ncbi:phosphoadenylyl-sulfate reductase [Patulibacter brassicae]|jgi:phosphoadenosine phosphosulfate reductase|uniref:Adenosine 5'-phosphosulfate reductase n=1 Tax=Patulibacter brassicae TaxID=1705717 RepID=A0ABU4VKZ2_9ACTN|nr:phosphoadenylyl-sulfate reductase [Patulibacter brassicae]MDX8152514.1 phosphoadenylyl-sulfate reductase [Patulibacter brassicae]
MPTDAVAKLELPDLESASARDVVAYALERYHPRIALACSFQKEESVLLDLIFSVRPDARVFALDTGLLFEETYDLWRQVEERYDTTIERWRGPTLAEQAERYGDQLWARDPSQCCAIRKVEPLRRGLAELDAWITGIRRDQSPARATAAKVEWDAAFGLVKVNPLADWSDQDVWRHVMREGLPYNPLHDRDYASIGCVPCTRPGAGREGRWAGNDKTECGLHLEDA